MAYIQETVCRATISIRQRTAIALLGVGLVATFAWAGLLGYSIIRLIGRLV